MLVLFLLAQWTSFLNSSQVYDMASYSNHLLIGTTGGAVIFNKEDTSFVPITNVDGLLSNDVIRVEIDDYGNFWFLCTEGGITVMSQDRSRSRRFTYLEGLPSYDFSAICIIGDIVWVGTNDEYKVWRYDMEGDPFTSNDFVTVNIKPTNEVEEIRVIGDSIWFGTNRGIGVRSLVGDSFTVYDVNDGLPSDTVLAITNWGGYIWAGTTKGTARRIGSRWEVVDSSRIKVHDFCWDSDSLWEATSLGTKKWESGSWTEISHEDARAVLFDSSLWIGTFGSGIEKHDGGPHSYVPPGPATNQIFSLAVDHEGDAWMTHWEREVSNLYHDGEWRWKICNKDNPWEIGGPTSVVVADRENNIWITMWDWTDAVGAVKITPDDSIVKVRINGGTNANVIVNACVDAENSLWIACWDKCIRRIRNNVVDTVISNQYITDRVLALLIDMDNDLWVGNRYNGLVILPDEGGVLRIPDFPIDETESINMDPRTGDVWVATYAQGIYQIKNKEIAASYTEADIGGYVSDIAIDNEGGAWFAVPGIGLRKLNPDSSFETYDQEDGLVSNEVLQVEFDAERNVLWIGTEKGLSRYALPSGVDERSNHPLSTGNSQLTVSPNPFTHNAVVEFRVRGSEFVDVETRHVMSLHIHDLSGRIVKSLGLHISPSPCPPVAEWDGTNSAGNEMAPGVYFVKTKGYLPAKVIKL